MDKIRILIVEDEIIVARDTENMLMNFGYEVLGIAGSGEEAISLTAEISPDVILMDIRLRGDMDGIEAAGRIRELHGIPVIFVTAHADEKSLQRAKLAGPIGYLLKPFEEKELRMTLETAISRWEMDRELRKREVQYRTLVESLKEGIAQSDIEERFTFANKAAHEILGVPPGTLVGRNLCEFVDDENYAIVLTQSERRRDGKSDTYEMQIRRPDGERRDLLVTVSPQFDSKGNYGGTFAVLHDITDRKRAEEAVQREASKLSAMIEGMEEGVAFIDRQDRVIEVNAYFLKLFNQEKSAVCGRLLWESELGEILGEFRNVSSHVKTKEETSQLVIQKDIAGLKTVVRMQPVCRDGAYQGSIINIIDVTELALAREKALAASRAKSNFLANMSHEIRTPLNAIVGITDMMFDTNLDAEQRDYVGMIKESSGSLLAIVSDILDFSKIEAGHVKLESVKFDLLALVEGVSEILACRARQKGLEFASRVDPRISRLLKGDPARLRQVLLNLGDNAVKFTARGSVEVRAGLERSDGDEARVLFSVTDTGVGVAREDQALIFEGFAQADSSITRKFGGTGLGLSISKQLVEMMGGEIGLDSPLGAENRGGSRFWFRIPFRIQAQPVEARRGVPGRNPTERPAPCQNPGPRPLRAAERPRPPARILLVEDNSINQKVTKAILQKAGFRIDVAENGRRALEAVAEEAYDLILMDMQMPEMGGLEAAGRNRRNLPNGLCPPIIALTANSVKEDMERCLESGMNDYLTKPVQASELVAKVKKWIRSSLENLTAAPVLLLPARHG
ncbi:MAG: response regulator [Candidatus Aminicenantales bacterium]